MSYNQNIIQQFHGRYYHVFFFRFPFFEKKCIFNKKITVIFIVIIKNICIIAA